MNVRMQRRRCRDGADAEGDAAIGLPGPSVVAVLVAPGTCPWPSSVRPC